jgi:hypothetical protein
LPKPIITILFIASPFLSGVTINIGSGTPPRYAVAPAAAGKGGPGGITKVPIPRDAAMNMSEVNRAGSALVRLSFSEDGSSSGGGRRPLEPSFPPNLKFPMLTVNFSLLIL